MKIQGIRNLDYFYQLDWGLIYKGEETVSAQIDHFNRKTVVSVTGFTRNQNMWFIQPFLGIIVLASGNGAEIFSPMENP